MPDDPNASSPPAALEAFLLGRIDFEVCLDLQRRLLSQVAARDDGQVVLLLCEHDAIVTIGRGGSPAQVHTQNTLVRTGQVKTLWVNRGGGCVVHCAGQLAVYPLVPLRWHGFSVGTLLERLTLAAIETLDEFNIAGQTRPGRWGIWGRSGQLADIGLAVRHGVSYYGLWLNVAPPLGLMRLAHTAADDPEPMSSLAAERCGPVRMPTVRAALVQHLTDALGCDRYHLYTGHLLLRQIRSHGPAR